jgi:type VI secretion system protein ImpC
MPERLQFELGTQPRTRSRREDDEPMRLLVMGDFRGNAGSERPPLTTRPTLQIDVDNFDDVMHRLDPGLSMPAGDIRFKQIDDFHPDQLYARLGIFQSLRNRRSSPADGAADDLDRLLGRAARPAPPAARPPVTGLDALIHDAVAPHIVKDTRAETEAHLTAVDTAIADQMRALLHDDAFQSLEAAWRGIHWLVSNLELGEALQVHLLDVSRDELLADIVAANGKIAQTGLYRALVDRWRNVPGGEGWSGLIGLTRFGASAADIGLLAALGLIASQAGAPFIADADLALSGGEESALGGWHALRGSEAAPWIALATPRILLRRPYGKRTDPIEAFGFEEIAGPPEPNQLLWGHASLAVGLLIGRAFTDGGWNLDLDAHREIADLPLYTFTRDGEPEMQPCGERVLTESDIRTVLEAGLVPIASRRDRNAVVPIRVQSIAEPPGPLTW